MKKDHYAVAEKIEKYCDQIHKLCVDIEKFVEEKKLSNAKRLYRKAMETAARTLKADGMPVGMIKILAEGKCADEEATVIEAEIEWKATLTKLDGAKSILNGWQSYNRYLDQTV